MASENNGQSTPAELSRDIKLLGGLLGVIIREQHGEEAFQAVEQVRAAAKARRAGTPDAADTLAKLIDSQDLPTHRVLIKAFSNYFQLINIAEDRHRIRVREHGMAGVPPKRAVRRAAGAASPPIRCALSWGGSASAW